MRAGVIQRVVGRLLWFAVGSLLVPLLTSAVLREAIWWAWLIPLLCATGLAYGIAHLPSALAAPTDSLRRREGFLAVTLGWMVLVFFAALAFHLSGYFPSFAAAFFESMSGFTTTGATVINDIEALPASILLMRSLSHWMGGMGIIVLSVAILPELAVGGMQLFSAESSGLDADKLAPRIAATARRLWLLYFGLTLIETALLWLGDMSLFDAINHSMSTIATGGFSTRNTSIASYDSLYIELVILVFMWLSGIPFALQFRGLFMGQPQRMLRSPEVRLYSQIVAIAIVLVTWNLYANGVFVSIGESLRYGAFQVVSIATTTGFGTHDFDTWPHFSRVLLVGLMLTGACAGSTAGGFKVIRLYVVAKHAVVQIRRLVRPRLVQTLAIGSREVPRETTESILGFFLLYFAIINGLGLALTALGLDLVSGTTAAISMMNSIGPGLGSVGAAESFAQVPDTGLYLLSSGMLLGRLEIYPILVLFSTHFWRRG